MTEEEKKAIEYLKDYIKSDLNYFTIDFNNNLRISMNLIEKLKKENEELKYENLNLKEERMIDNSSCKPLNNFYDYYDYIPKDKIREKIENYQNEIECENSYLEQGIICEEEYKDRVKVYNSYIFILNKLLEEE